MNIRLVSIADAERLVNFYQENHDHLKLWEPLREDGYHSSESWAARLITRVKEQENGQSAYFAAFDENEKIIAVCSLTNIIRGPFLACHMGYAVAKDQEGKGVMKNLCGFVIDYAFNQLHLHRLMANYMPNNERSRCLLETLGFRQEGLAKSYLKINGKWEDHVLTSLVNPINF